MGSIATLMTIEKFGKKNEINFERLTSLTDKTVTYLLLTTI